MYTADADAAVHDVYTQHKDPHVGVKTTFLKETNKTKLKSVNVCLPIFHFSPKQLKFVFVLITMKSIWNLKSNSITFFLKVVVT